MYLSPQSLNPNPQVVNPRILSESLNPGGRHRRRGHRAGRVSAP